MTPQEVVNQYPIKNKGWDFCSMTERFVTEASEWENHTPPRTDPWGRPFPKQEPRVVRKNFEPENEIEYWVYQTTVNKDNVECVIYND